MVSDMCLKPVTIGEDGGQRSSLAAVAQARNPVLSGIVALMQNHREEPLRIGQLAEQAGYSRRHIERLFDRSLGVTPARFYMDLRLDYARNLLASTDKSPPEIAGACGFGATSHFTRCFAKRFGSPPHRIPRSAAPTPH